MLHALRSLTHGVGELVVRLFASIGLLAGMYWMVNTPVAAASCVDSSKPTATDLISRCAQHTLEATIVHYGVGLLGGLVFGGAVGVLIVMVSVVLRGAGSANVPPRAVAAPVVVGGRSHWITTRYPGRCAACGTAVRAGERVRHSPGVLRCSSCSS